MIVTTLRMYRDTERDAEHYRKHRCISAWLMIYCLGTIVVNALNWWSSDSSGLLLPIVEILGIGILLWAVGMNVRSFRRYHKKYQFFKNISRDIVRLDKAETDSARQLYVDQVFTAISKL